MYRSKSNLCLVFDLDDTLFYEIDFVRSGFQVVSDELSRRYGIDCGLFLVGRVESNQLEGSFQEVLDSYDLPVGALDDMVKTYRHHKPKIILRDNVLKTLKELKRLGVVIGCITDGRSLTQRNKIAALGIQDALDVILISEETGRSKPHPYNFQEIMKTVNAEEYWYVADNPEKDFIGPNQLGWKTVGVRGSRNLVNRDLFQYSTQQKPIRWIQSVYDLIPDVIKR